MTDEADTEEAEYECRFDGCTKTYASKSWRGRHQSQEHDYESLLLDDLKRVAEDMGRPPKKHEFENRDDCPSSEPYKNRFGSWNYSLEKVGLNVHETTKSYGELLDEIRRVAKDLGHIPTKREFKRRDDCPSISPYKNHFDGWADAIEKADPNEERVNNASSTTINRELQKWRSVRWMVRHRDNHRCQVCGIHRNTLGRQMSVHHITPRNLFKSGTADPKLDIMHHPSNLVSLCQSCHRSLEGNFVESDPHTFVRKGREYLGYTKDNELVQSLTSQARTGASVAAD